eukprot:CAMPEP_0183489046 /NCGR_PEP_ID=MMETSP0370-20130417/181248_1 /TAXON_ID=268820 /ORGANISM="Peridinium aciculiferum, Strain PAER-2" /LENGTH=366 /DNA_ID=CAMNT_0025682379 /DNA_START=42 /DNA_END=1139 /DNA_ORIENTATION=-
MGNRVAQVAKGVAGGVKGAVCGGVAGFYVGFDQAGDAQSEDSKTVLVSKGTFSVCDENTLIAATVSQWVYLHGQTIVRIEDRTHGAAAYYGEKKWATEDIDGYIPYGSVLPVLESGPSLKDDIGQLVLKVRWLGMAVYVKQKNTTPEDTNKMKQFLQKQHEKHGTKGDISERIVRATLLPAGPLSPSAAAVFVRPRQPGDGTMMFIAWQGTQAADRPMDIFTDLAGAPARCTAWNQTHDTLWAHSAMLAKSQSDFLEHWKKVEGVMRVEGQAEGVMEEVSHVVFTGHSLGAGCALIAHMLALTDAPASSLVKGVSVESIVFASPMVWYSPNGGAGNIGDDIKDIFRETSVNYVFDQDVVPRLPGLP